MVGKRSQVSSWLEGGAWGRTEEGQHPLSLAGPKNKQKRKITTCMGYRRNSVFK